MASALVTDNDSDSEYDNDFSIEDEQLLASLADGSPKGRTPIVGLARSDSIDAFVRKTQPQSAPAVGLANDITYPDLSMALTGLEREGEAREQPKSPEDPATDTRSPLLRFRTFPKKPFSVSDLTAGAWCELQYEYTLTRLPGGKKTQTKAMKQGSKVHKQLEDEVYTTVQVEIVTKEDAFGLKIWNIIQGLRTLRDTGMTRELEVWGLVDGNVVNGLIDFLSYENPNPEFEEEWLSSQESQGGAEEGSQRKMTNFLPSDRLEEPKPKDVRKIYLTDVKTRATNSMPKGAALRPTKVQLYLYHRFLADMASDKINFLQVFRRYGLDIDRSFSDAFLAQISEIHDDVFQDAQSNCSATMIPLEESNTQDLLRYRTLQELVALLRYELKLTFPAGAESLGSVVTVEYRLREEESALIGTTIIAVDPEILDQYLNGYMEWWRGERPASGVDIEEAYKCSFCEFADICTWRGDIDKENLKRAQEKTTVPVDAQADGHGHGHGPQLTAPKPPRTRRRGSRSKS